MISETERLNDNKLVKTFIQLNLLVNEKEALVEEGNKKSSTKSREIDVDDVGMKKLSDFMKIAGEPITWVEARELWHDQRKMNQGKFPLFRNSFMDISQRSLQSLGISQHSLHQFELEGGKLAEKQANTKTKEAETVTTEEKISSTMNNSRHSIGLLIESELDLEEKQSMTKGPKTVTEEIETGAIDGKALSSLHEDEMYAIFDEASIKDLNSFSNMTARRIKETYAIRLSGDKAELKFILFALALTWTATIGVSIASLLVSEHNEKVGSFTLKIPAESFALFAIELIWECFLSWIVLRFNIKINYTRKLGNLLKVPKYFIADLIPGYSSTALSMMMALAINQTLFCLIYYRKTRERVPFCAFVFLSQDRREDRPDTLIFQVTEDIMRFAIYFPFKLLIADFVGSKAIIFIPIIVNNIGDGLAEPVGVAFGRHKYTTTALYHKGKFFQSKFTRSYEGSSCVFLATVFAVGICYNEFTKTQFWITVTILPFLMAVAEAKAPHTNDGPFLALIGCGFLTAVLLIGR